MSRAHTTQASSAERLLLAGTGPPTVELSMGYTANCAS